MNEIIISNLKENSLKCNLCGSLNTRHIRQLEDGITTECWFRCLGCKKDYGAKLNFYKLQDGTVKINTEITWTKGIKDH